MIRARILRRPSKADPYEYKNTVFLGNDDLEAAGRRLVVDHDLKVDDLVYMGDWYLRVVTIEPKVTWVQIVAGSPEVKGLYDKIVAAETKVGEVWQ